MISLINTLQKRKIETAEFFKIKSTFSAYKDIALIYSQEDKTFISVLDSNAVIDYGGTDTEEIKKFLNITGIKTVFSSRAFFEKAGLPFEPLSVFKTEEKFVKKDQSDTLSSKEVYSLLSSADFELPEYPAFAVDFCHRLNHGLLSYFAKKDRAVCILFKQDKTVLINGIVSKEKGLGSPTLKNALANEEYNTAFAVIKPQLAPFYLKNGFSEYYSAGLWRKTDELF